MSWRCFWLNMDGTETRSLRRYVSGSAGSEHFHEALVRIEDGPLRLEATPRDGRRWRAHRTDADGFRDDPRWPQACECGHRFGEEDVWQVWGHPYYWGTDGRRFPMGEIPIGGMVEAEWMSGYPAWSGPDGRSIMVKLPPGREYDWWHIDGPSNNGGGWTRTGTPPDLSVSPSILTPAYHGFLGSAGTPPGWLSGPL